MARSADDWSLQTGSILVIGEGPTELWSEWLKAYQRAFQARPPAHLLEQVRTALSR